MILIKPDLPVLALLWSLNFIQKKSLLFTNWCTKELL